MVVYKFSCRTTSGTQPSGFIHDLVWTEDVECQIFADTADKDGRVGSTIFQPNLTSLLSDMGFTSGAGAVSAVFEICW